MANSGRPTFEELQRLPRRALVAYALRCARRILPLYTLPDDAVWLHHYKNLERALDSVELFASGSEIPLYHANDSANAAASAVDIQADRSIPSTRSARSTCAAARGAALAAAHASYAVYAGAYAAHAADAADTTAYSTAHAAAREDYNRLMYVIDKHDKNKRFDVDPGANGPLGTLWPRGEPRWYVRALAASRERFQRVSQSLDAERLREAATVSDEHLVLGATIGEFVDHDDAVAAILDFKRALDEFHIASGGNGLVIDEWKLYARADVAVGVV